MIDVPRRCEASGRHPVLSGEGDHVRTVCFVDLAAVERGRTGIEDAVRAWCKWKDTG
jgi:hypothetical protein